MTTANEKTQHADEGRLEPIVRPKLLWAVRVVREAYVLAETQAEAEEMAPEIEQWEEPQISVGSGSVDLGWPGACNVYHNGKGDITLAQARRDFAAA